MGTYNLYLITHTCINILHTCLTLSCKHHVHAVRCGEHNHHNWWYYPLWSCIAMKLNNMLNMFVYYTELIAKMTVTSAQYFSCIEIAVLRMIYFCLYKFHIVCIIMSYKEICRYSQDRVWIPSIHTTYICISRCIKITWNTLTYFIHNLFNPVFIVTVHFFPVHNPQVYHAKSTWFSSISIMGNFVFNMSLLSNEETWVFWKPFYCQLL